MKDAYSFLYNHNNPQFCTLRTIISVKCFPMYNVSFFTSVLCIGRSHFISFQFHKHSSKLYTHNRKFTKNTRWNITTRKSEGVEPSQNLLVVLCVKNPWIGIFTYTGVGPVDVTGEILKHSHTMIPHSLLTLLHSVYNTLCHFWTLNFTFKTNRR